MLFFTDPAIVGWVRVHGRVAYRTEHDTYYFGMVGDIPTALMFNTEPMLRAFDVVNYDTKTNQLSAWCLTEDAPTEEEVSAAYKEAEEFDKLTAKQKARVINGNRTTAGGPLPQRVYRCTRCHPYGDINSVARLQAAARQGFYIRAVDERAAYKKMLEDFVNETNFTVDQIGE